MAAVAPGGGAEGVAEQSLGLGWVHRSEGTSQQAVVLGCLGGGDDTA
jgi:hypothetical protein